MRSITNIWHEKNQRHLKMKACRGSSRSSGRRRAILAAAGALALTTSAWGQLYFDNNGTASGLGSGTGTWNALLTNWAPSSAGTTNQAWTAGDIANFQQGNAILTIDLLDAESIGGLTFNSTSTNTSGATVITTTAGTTGEELDIGTSTYDPVGLTGGYLFTQSGTGKAVIGVPIVGSGDIVGSSNTNNGSYTLDFAGNMSQFTGNMYLNNKSGFGSGNTTGGEYQLDSPTGGTGTIYLDQNVFLTSNNQVGTSAAPLPGAYGDYSTGTLVGATPNIFTISNPMVLNYKGASGSAGNTIGAANGPTINSIKYQKIVTYSGNISSSTANSNLIIGGTNGTTVLSGNNTYTGNTYAAYSNSNGFLQLGSSTALPSSTVFVFGNNMSSATGSVGPMDLSGNNISIAGLQTGSSGNTALAVGNIYNLSIVNTAYPVMANGQPSGTSGTGYQTNPSGNASTIAITSVSGQSLVFNGDIGDTNVGAGTGTTVQPFTNNAPYSDGNGDGKGYVTALTNISLTLNGPSTPNSGNNVLTLAPVDTYNSGSASVTGLPNGNEYVGTTTVNANATLVMGRGFDKQTPASYSGTIGTAALPLNYTLTGGGDVIVNSGGTLATLSSPAGFSIGGAQGNIILKSGSSFLPGQGAISGSQGAKGTTTTLSPNNVGTFATNTMEFDAGASMSFSIASGSSFDYVYLNGNLTLDDPNNSNHTININATATGAITPGTYNLINANSINGTGSSFTLNTSSLPAAYANDIFSLSVNSGYLLQLNVQAPLLQWDPLGTGAANHAGGGVVTEQGGEWTDGNGSDGAPATSFYNSLTGTEATWSNTSTFEVLIGNDPTQNGGVITLGNNIVVTSGIEFGPIAVGANYSIHNSNGNNYSLTIGSGGIQVANAAAGSTTPSAEIDVPVVLSASQTWNVQAGQFFNVTGAVTQSTSGTTLTVTGGGNGELSGANGNISNVAISGGSILVLGDPTAIGSAAINLNNGGVQYACNASPTNSLTIGTLGGALGATTGFTLTYAPSISTPYGFEAIGSGNTIFQGSVSAGALQVSTISPGGATFNAAVTVGTPTVAGALSVKGGTNAFNGMITVNGTSTFTGGAAYFNNSGSANVFTGGITIQGGLVYAQSSNALGNATITFPGSPTGGLDIAGASTLSNPLNGTGSGAGAGGNSYGDTIYFDNTHPFTLTGSTEGTGDLRWYSDPNYSGGANPTIIFDEASTRPGGGAQYFNISSASATLTIVIPNDPNVNTTFAMGLSTESFMTKYNTNLDVEAPVAVTGCLRGEQSSSGGDNLLNVTKTGPGTLALSGSAGSSTPGSITIDDGEVQVPSATALGGQAQSSTIPVIGATVNNSGIYGLDYSGRQGGMTLNNGGTLKRDNTYYSGNTSTTPFSLVTNNMLFEVDMTAATAADVVNITGSGGTIEDGAIQGSPAANTTSTNELFTLRNPVVVNTGATLKLQNDNPAYNGTTGGYDISYILALRGPSTASNTYDTLTIQPGAAVVNSGPGQVRFGQTTSSGVPIIAQGTPGSDALLQLGTAGGNDNFYMTDTSSGASSFNTIFVLNGSGSAGLRIEAPMNATYEDPNSPSASPALPIGSTGLFGINTTITAPVGGTVPSGYFSGVGNAFTAASPNRLQALSLPYTYTDASSTSHTITPSGTLTLAANDAGDVTGQINDGPLYAPGAVVNSVAQGSVALALDNTAGSSGKHIYQINPAVDANGGSFANFAGLTVERTASLGASVTAQLLGTTLTPSLTISGGASMDITNQALAVDPGASGTPQLSTIAGYLGSGYDQGKWDGAGINSSMIAGLAGTSIGYALNSMLPADDQFTNFGGQNVSLNAVLVKYTWDGDLNLDGVVNSEDLALMADGNPGWIGGDLNYDGKVNADDWSLMMKGAAFQTGQLTSAVPEPSALGLLAGSGLLMRRRRRV